MAICEDLARSGAYTYVTTHYTMLTKLADLFVNMKVWQMRTIPSGDPTNPKTMKLDYKYNLVPGTTTLRGYGIYMVRNIWPVEVLQHVDELQGELIETTNNAKFPSLDKRFRLKYDLECKLTKLKLQKKLTIANLNKHINEYNNEMAKMGETPHNSQIVLQDLHSTTGREDDLDHSVFNVSKNNGYEYPEFENSKIYLNDIAENRDAVHCVSQPELSPIYPYDDERVNQEEDVVLSPVSTQHSLQTPITSPSKAKQRMQDIFTPDTNLDRLSSQSEYHSAASDHYYGLLAPEVNLSYSASNCSLNLTKNALCLEEGIFSQIRNTAEDPQITNTQNNAYEALSEHIYSDCERSRNLFKESQNVRSPIVSYGASQVSSCDLSQQVAMIREERRNLTFTKEIVHPPPDLSPECTVKNSEIDSPFLNTFVRPLQSDITKTSTPLITKVKLNARNFESSSTSTRTPVQDRTEGVATPRISFTILNRVENVDMHSVQEDLESFVEYMQDEDFHSEEDVNSSKEHHNNISLNINEEGSKNKEDENRNKINKPMNIPVENTNSEQDNVYQNAQKYKSINFFPAVNIIEGPNDPSFEEDTNYTFVDKETIIQPIVRDPQHQPNNQANEEILIKAFNSLSEYKLPVLTQNTENNASNEKNNNRNKTKYIGKHENDNVGVDQRDLTSINKTVSLEKENTEKNDDVDILIEAFNSISKPRGTGVIHDTSATKLGDKGKSHPLQNRYGTKHVTDLGENDVINTFKDGYIDILNSSDDICEPARDVDGSKQYVEMEPINKCHVRKYSNKGLNEKENISKEIEENSMVDCYQSVKSSQEISYSPLDSHQKVYFNNKCTNHDTFEARPNDSKKTDVPNKENSNLSNFYKPNLQKSNTSSVTDYNKSTEKMYLTRHNSIEQEGTETEIIQKNVSESNYDTASPQETQRDNQRKSTFYSNLSVDSDSLPNYEDAIISPGSKPSRINSDTNIVVVDSGDAVNSISLETCHNIKSNDLNRDAKSLQKKQGFKNGPLEVSNSNLLESYTLSENRKVYSDSNSGNNLKPKTVTSSIKKEICGSNKKSNFYKNLSVDSGNSLGHGDAESPNKNTALESTAINVEKLSTDHACSTYVSVTNVIQTVDEKTLNLNKYKIDKCKETLQKENELMNKIRHMRDKTMENPKTKENVLNNKDNLVPHIPYLSPYSSCSSSIISDKDNKRDSNSKDSFTSGSNEINNSQRKKAYSRKRTLGIARHGEGSSDLKLRKMSKRNSEQKVIDKENVRQKEGSQTTDKISEKDVEGSEKYASSEKDADNRSVDNTSLGKRKLEEVTLVTDTGSEKNKATSIISKKNRKRGLKRRKFSQNKSTSFIAPCTQNRAIEEKTITTISEASKLRNLDGDFSSSFSVGKSYCLENASGYGEDYKEKSSEGQQEKTVTSISDASRIRNLDQSTNSSLDKRPSENSIYNAVEKPSSDLLLSESTNKNQPRKHSKPIGQETKETADEQKTSSFINDISSSSKADTTNTQDQSNVKLLKSGKLSKKAIQEAFYEQDKKFFESSGSSIELAKMWEQRLRRPTLRQIQRSTCLATLRKTEKGVEIIPEKEKTKRKYSKKDKILSSNTSSVNMNIFSDKNAETFDMFIKSDTKNFKSFNFNFGYGAEATTSRNDGKMFDFKQMNSVPLGYNQNRNPSADYLQMSQQSSQNLPFLTQNADFSLTPEGFYKQNRDNINQLLKKYN